MSRENTHLKAYMGAEEESKAREARERGEGEEQERSVFDTTHPDFKKRIDSFLAYAKTQGKLKTEDLQSLQQAMTQTDPQPLERGLFNRATELRVEFNEKWKKAEKLAETVDPEFIARIAENKGGRFKGFVSGADTAESLAELWKKQIPHLMAQNPRQFEKLSRAIIGLEPASLQANEKLMQAAEKRVKSLKLGKKGEDFDAETYLRLMGEKDENKRAENLAAVIGQRYGSWRQALSESHGTGRISPERIAREGKKELEAELEQLDTQLSAIAASLYEVNIEDAETGKAYFARFGEAYQAAAA